MWGVYLFCLQFLSFTSSFCPVSNFKYRRHRRPRLWRESEMNSVLVVLQKLHCFLNFRDAAASGTIPAAGPGSSVEVPAQGTVPGWLRRENLLLPSRQGHAADSSSVCLRAWVAFGSGWSWELCSGAAPLLSLEAGDTEISFPLSPTPWGKTKTLQHF